MAAEAVPRDMPKTASILDLSQLYLLSVARLRGHYLEFLLGVRMRTHIFLQVYTLPSLARAHDKTPQFYHALLPYMIVCANSQLN